MDDATQAALESQMRQLRQDMLKAIADSNPTRPAGAPARQFFQTGLFFIFLGLMLLFFAFITLEWGVHTSFSFVLVVLGIAILLFGTGTQGIGTLDSNTPTARYNVAIAGGAGVLAIVIGFGMTELATQIQQTFALETRYVEAKLQPQANGNSSFEGYWGQFTIDGQPIPSVHRGDFFFAYIPYKEAEKDAIKHVAYVLVRPNSAADVPSLRPVIKESFDVPIKAVSLNNSGSDFPIYENIPPVDMREPAETLLKISSSRTLGPAAGAESPNAAPAADTGGS